MLPHVGKCIVPKHMFRVAPSFVKTAHSANNNGSNNKNIQLRPAPVGIITPDIWHELAGSSLSQLIISPFVVCALMQRYTHTHRAGCVSGR